MIRYESYLFDSCGNMIGTFGFNAESDAIAVSILKDVFDTSKGQTYNLWHTSPKSFGSDTIDCGYWVKFE